MKRRDHDLVGDGAGSFLSQRARLAKLLGYDAGLPERKPLPEPAGEKKRRVVVPIKRGRP